MIAWYTTETYDEATHRVEVIDASQGSNATLTSAGTTVVDFGVAQQGLRPRVDAEGGVENRAVALRAMPLSAEAATVMERMLDDLDTVRHEGAELPTVSAEELLRRFGR